VISQHLRKLRIWPWHRAPAVVRRELLRRQRRRAAGIGCIGRRSRPPRRWVGRASVTENTGRLVARSRTKTKPIFVGTITPGALLPLRRTVASVGCEDADTPARRSSAWCGRPLPPAIAAALGQKGSWPAIIGDLDALTETEVEQGGRHFMLRSAPRPTAILRNLWASSTAPVGTRGFRQDAISGRTATSAAGHPWSGRLR
jgi:hypothetical protein